MLPWLVYSVMFFIAFELRVVHDYYYGYYSELELLLLQLRGKSTATIYFNCS